MADSTNGQILFEKNHFLIVPSDPEQREFTELVERACRASLLNDYRVRLNAGYTTTFACVYIEAMVMVLGKLMKNVKEETSINFLDLFTVSVNNRESDSGDKDGNINLAFTPGPTVQTIMERDFAPVVDPESWQKTIINQIERECAIELSKKHKAVVDKAYNLTLIAYAYFEALFRTIKLRAKEAHEAGKMSTSINFLEMFEVHCNLEVKQNPENPDLHSEEYIVKIRPGFESKLLIKSDDTTEDENSIYD